MQQVKPQFAPIKVNAEAHVTWADLGGEADIGSQLFPRAAAVLEALHMQQQHLRQPMEPHTLCGFSLLCTDFTLEAFITLQHLTSMLGS